MIDTPRQQVLVVGGGIAGLTAAVGLAREGLTVTVLERDSLLGGRACSWTDEETGDPVTIGPHIFLNHYPNFLELQRAVGAEGTIVWQDLPLFLTLVDGQQVIEMRSAALPPPYHFVPSLLRDPRVGLRDLASNWPLVQYAMELTEEGVRALDGLNASAFLHTMGVSENFQQRFWAFLSLSLLNVPLEICSAGSLMRIYRRLVGHADLQVGFPAGGLGDTFAPQSRAFLEAHGGRVLTDAAVEAFLGDDARVTGVRLADGRELTAPHVVAALTPAGLRRLARPAWIRQHATFADLVHFQPVPYVSVTLWFDRKLTDRRFWARAHDPNDLNCDFYDYANIIPGRDPARGSLICSNIIWSHRVAESSDGEIVAETRRELNEFLPGAAEAKLERCLVNRIPMAIHAPFPGVDARRPAPRTPVGGLTLAGDWIQTGFPSSMESAAASGWMAAEAILSDVGRPKPLLQEHRDVEGLTRILRRLAPLLPGRRRARWLKALRPR